ncbi:hypothetical protein EV127DRAFT_446473 [Xylaria flabelliformis]|nr:hypothetical protein EV127DRAFT_446473 [Xylaria flabelliformis]
MEALAALGLAANIAQFIATAGTVVKKTHELALSKKSLQKENEELDIIAHDFSLALPAIRTAASSAIQTSDEASLALLEQGAREISQEIEQLLNTVKKQRAKRSRSAKLLATLKELKLYDALKDLNERLSSFRDQIGLRINQLLLKQQTRIQNALDRYTREADTYRSEVIGRLDDVRRLVQSSVIGSGDPHDEQNNRSWRGTSQELATVVRALRSWHPHLVDFYKTEGIVTGLDFSQVEERQNAIVDAHRQTYRWIFDAATANLKTWLAVEHAPIYWIAGNAGSGKSTLMKFIHKHPAMLKGLEAWIGSRPILVASHFFWLAGTPIQQSQEGLLRSLLYQILRTQPEVTRHVFPARWQTSNSLLDRKKSVIWSTKELLDAFFALPRILGDHRLLIFIDGLDEYSGEHDDLVSMIKALGTASNVKVCVSSRPWLAFSDAFSASPWKLYLQDLTKSDIRIFIHDKLEAHAYFRRLSTRNQVAAENLVTQITTRAQGVFLWVYLVVRSLVRGLTNADTIRDLQRRVDEVPQQLEDFFARILDSIDPFYMSRTARIFLVLAHARSSLPLISFYFLDRDEEGLPFEPKTFLDNWPDVNEDELDLITTKKRQLIAQCKDLIDIIELPEEPIMFNFSVLFPHRTVVDFINQPRILNRLFEQVGGEFKPAVALFEVHSGQFGSLLHLMNRNFLKPCLCNWLLGSVYYAREVEVTHEISLMEKLYPLEVALMGYFRTKHETEYSFSKALSILGRDLPKEKEPSWMQKEEDRKFRSLQSFASACGLNPQDIEAKGIQSVDVQVPSLYIEKAGDFEIGLVTDEMKKNRPDFLVAKPIYNNTFEMFTLSEAEALKRSRLLVKQPSVMMTPAQSSPYGPEAVISGQQKPGGKSHKLKIRKLLFWR